ncbi:MAG: hypothetical protein CM1200mP30_06030 [Pseudomonadota bacterium]|nr:MAG: hypothetical protein CM1200mP30_06030 [Pseudomonadota bacterium]
MKRENLSKTQLLQVAQRQLLPQHFLHRRLLKVVLNRNGATWGRDFPGLGTGAQRFAKRLSDMTDGRMNVTYFAANERVKPFDSFDEVASGNAKCISRGLFLGKGETPWMGIFHCCSFWHVYSEINAWIILVVDRSLGRVCGKFWPEMYAMWKYRCPNGGWFRKEINSLMTLKVLK